MIQRIFISLLLAGMSFALPVHAQQPEDDVPETAEQAPIEGTEPGSERYSISSGLDEEAIAQRWPDQVVWLELEDDDPALALQTLEQITPARGAMVILADEGSSAAGGFAGALREPMAERGWAVMTLGLAELPLAVEQSRRLRVMAASSEQETAQADETPEPGGAGDSVMIDVIEEESVADLEKAYLDRVRATVSAAVQQVRDGGYDRVVLAGIGRGSEHVTRFAVESAGVEAVVWIAADFSVATQPVAEMLSGKGPWPLLDLHHSGGDQNTAARERQAALSRAGISGYRRKPVVVGQPVQSGQAASVASHLAASLSDN